MTSQIPILETGRNCWRIERAGRMALIVDAADYFRHVKSAMLQARHSIMLVGWDFDTRIKLEPDEQTLEGPNSLGEFLSWLPKQRKDLNIYLLKWDLGMIQALGRGMTPLFVMDWLTDRRLHLRLDHAHPVGAAHHQKIVVIDDALAFCGGIDMTTDRWDTPEHRDDNPLRTKPSGRPYGPWHDATTAVDGDVALAIGELARNRWRSATGKQLPSAPRQLKLWPEGLEPTVENVDVAIARTQPELNEQKEVFEIQSLYLDAISRAEETIYIETQYLASPTIADAIIRRLRQPVGPEIILVLPKSTEGWLEHKAMDGARRTLLHKLWDSDEYGRFAAYYPVTAAEKPIYVHAKILIIDDRLLRIGSSNLNNRSMTFDTECDLALESSRQNSADDGLSKAITDIRRDLLCEHLHVNHAEFSTQLNLNSGSVLDTIEAIQKPGRSLKRFTPDIIKNDRSILAYNTLLDPEAMPRNVSQQIGDRLRKLKAYFEKPSRA